MSIDPNAVTILLLSSLSIVTTGLGVLLALALGKNERAIAAGIGFSTGMMVLISLLELIPEAQEGAGVAGMSLGVALGAMLLWGANLVLPHSHLIREHGQADTRLVRSAYLVVIGLILHDLPEGFAMANAYIASPSLGVLIAVAIALHNLPEEFAMAVPAITLRSKRFLFGAAILSALAEPAGAVIGLVAVQIYPWLNAYFMALAAGAMLFVSFHELVPMARRYGKMIWFGTGLVLSFFMHQFLAFVITNAS